VLWDLARSGEQVIAARGGRGGVGNATRSASLTSCRPRPEGPRPEGARHSVRGRAGSRAELRGAAEAKPGSPGEQRQLILELKLVADVGLVGFPNAGKSSLLARISTAHPKIGAYPFTTRYPVLGVVNVEGRGSFIACDIPGLIEGAHQGKGLGIQFLRHIERTRMLLHVVDLAAVDGRDPEAAFHQLNHELTEYRLTLGQRPQLIVANKLDLPEARARLDAFTHAVQRPVWPISCATGAGIPALLEAVWKALGSIGESAR
ncbi:MAG: 50S ribosome-binding GTPase, partial [Candidatus Omnitrophica bacterium]|nr:50S ribosome-binding GTPase [Candidatus Omnitrophota bacterium]